MTDEQFERMYAVELSKLAALTSIMNGVNSLVVRQGGQVASYNWKDVARMLSGAAASVEQWQQAAEQKKPG